MEIQNICSTTFPSPTTTASSPFLSCLCYLATSSALQSAPSSHHNPTEVEDQAGRHPPTNQPNNSTQLAMLHVENHHLPLYCSCPACLPVRLSTAPLLHHVLLHTLLCVQPTRNGTSSPPSTTIQDKLNSSRASEGGSVVVRFQCQVLYTSS